MYLNLSNMAPGLLGSAVAPGSLLYRHPEYDRRWWWREFGRVSYRGGLEYHRPTLLSMEFQYPAPQSRDSNGQLLPPDTIPPDSKTLAYQSLLFRHNREKEWEFFNRRKRAYYNNFVRSIVNSLISHVTKKTPTRKTSDPLLDEFWGAVDKKRTQDVDQFIRTGLPWAQVEGLMWACVDAEASGKDTKPYAYWVSPLDILDWEVDDDGEIVWLKQFCYAEAKRRWDEAITQRYRFRIWTREGVVTWETDNTGGGQKQISSVKNRIGRVPFVPLFSIRDENYTFPDGTPLASDLCKAANHIYNLGSLLSEILYKQTFSWLAVPDKNVDVLQMGTNTAFGYDPSQSNAKPEFISPDADQARVLMEAINQAIEQARQSFGVGRGRMEGSMQKSSADALELESEDKRSILGDISAEAEDFERRLADMVRRYENKTSAAADPDPADVTIIYPRDFDLRSLTDEINEALSLRTFGVSPEVNLEMAQELVRRKFAGRDPEELQALVDTLKADQLAKMQAAADAAKAGGNPNVVDKPGAPSIGPGHKPPNQPDNAGQGNQPPPSAGRGQPAP